MKKIGVFIVIVILQIVMEIEICNAVDIGGSTMVSVDRGTIDNDLNVSNEGRANFNGHDIRINGNGNTFIFHDPIKKRDVNFIIINVGLCISVTLLGLKLIDWLNKKKTKK